MASILRKLFGYRRKKITKKDSVTGRNNTFPVPYLSKLEGNQLEPGQSLIVRGVISSNEEFVVNLTNGPRVELDDEVRQLDDRLLCMRVEMGPKRRKIHLNACINGEWGKEGVIKHKWQVGDEFDVRIRCHEDEFELFVDHKLSARFGHYVPLSQISHIYINGGAELYSVSWEGRTYTVPYSADIPGNFYPGRRLYVSGLVKKRTKRMQLDLCAGVNIAFRMTSKMGSPKKLVCNTRTEQSWGEEQRFQLEGDFPLKRKKAFDMLIYCEESKFVVYIDDCFVGKYDHRINPRTIDRLCIEGDLVWFQNRRAKYRKQEKQLQKAAVVSAAAAAAGGTGGLGPMLAQAQASMLAQHHQQQAANQQAAAVARAEAAAVQSSLAGAGAYGTGAGSAGTGRTGIENYWCSSAYPAMPAAMSRPMAAYPGSMQSMGPYGAAMGSFGNMITSPQLSCFGSTETAMDEVYRNFYKQQQQQSGGSNAATAAAVVSSAGGGSYGQQQNGGGAQ